VVKWQKVHWSSTHACTCKKEKERRHCDLNTISKELKIVQVSIAGEQQQVAFVSNLEIILDTIVGR